MKVHNDEGINISRNVIIVYLTNVYTQTYAYDCRMEISGVGEVNDDNITIKKRIMYKTPYPLDVREHVMQIMMRSGIIQYRITLPEGTN